MTASIELATGPMEFSALEKVLLQGDLKALTPEERIDYYGRVCNSLGLNPLTRPFQYIEFVNNGVKRLSLYAAKDCTEQLANRHIISVIPDEGREIRDTWIVRAVARDVDGRTVAATGAVFLGDVQGQVMANKMMTAETKACRRAVLRFCGLGMLDETEVETIPGAQQVTVDQDGVIIEPPTVKALASDPVTRLRKRLEREDMVWSDFLASVLGVESWQQYHDEGGTAGKAWEAFEKYEPKPELDPLARHLLAGLEAATIAQAEVDGADS